MPNQQRDKREGSTELGRKKKSTSQGGKKTDEDSPKPGKTAVEEHEAAGPGDNAENR